MSSATWATIVGLAVATFLIKAAGPVMFGGRAAIEPLMHQNTAHELNGSGEVVYAMPDSVFCRRMAFDNATAEITRADVEPCPATIGGTGAPNSAGEFQWGHR